MGTSLNSGAFGCGMARENLPAPVCPHPQGGALLTTPVGEVRPPMEHVPMRYPENSISTPRRSAPHGGLWGTSLSLLHLQSQAVCQAWWEEGEQQCPLQCWQTGELRTPS